MDVCDAPVFNHADSRKLEARTNCDYLLPFLSRWCNRLQGNRKTLFNPIPHKESRQVFYVHFPCNIWVMSGRYLDDTGLIHVWYSGGHLVQEWYIHTLADDFWSMKILTSTGNAFSGLHWDNDEDNGASETVRHRKVYVHYFTLASSPVWRCP